MNIGEDKRLAELLDEHEQARLAYVEADAALDAAWANAKQKGETVRKILDRIVSGNYGVDDVSVLAEAESAYRLCSHTIGELGQLRNRAGDNLRRAERAVLSHFTRIYMHQGDDDR